MDIWFKKPGIQKICSQKAASQKRLGVKTAMKLQPRMMELKAAASPLS